MTARCFVDKEIVMVGNKKPENFYILVEGTASAYLNGVETLLCVGDYFGAVSLEDSTPHYSVTATGNACVFWIPTKQLQTIFQAINRTVETRSNKHHVHTKTQENTKEGSKVKTDAQSKMLCKALASSLLCSSFDSNQLSAVVALMWKDEFPANATVMREGEQGLFVYVVDEGELSVSSVARGPDFVRIKPGEIVGELALIHSSPRVAAVTTTKPSVLWKIDRFTFRRVAMDMYGDTLRIYTDFLDKVDLLTPLLSSEKIKLAGAVDQVEFQPNSVIFKQGDPGDAMYIIMSGTVICEIEENGVKRLAATLSATQYFGERALMNIEPRSATVSSKQTSVCCLKISAAIFHLLLGSLQDLMQKRITEKNKALSGSTTSASMGSAKDDQMKIVMDDLTILGTLGKGSFGFVRLVRHKKLGGVFALKSVSKQLVLDTEQVAHIISEKRILESLRHPFICRLFATFKDDNEIHFMMEPVMGGELYSLMQRKVVFSTPEAHFYTAIVVETLAYLHHKNYVYRDMKPENLLLDADGYIKLVDFGFAKKLENDKTVTSCGTPEYVSPEVIQARGCGRGGDWWALGVLCYEMLCGHTPFYDSSSLRLFQNITEIRYVLPSALSPSSKDFIKKFLQYKPTLRLGMQHGGVNDIRQHPWFAGFDWRLLNERKFVAPNIPSIRNDSDLSNFSHDIEDHFVEKYTDDGSNWDADF